MSRKRVGMRKIREVLRLKWGLRLGEHDIAESCQLSRSTVWEYVRRANAAGISWPLPDDLDDDGLETKLFPPQATEADRPEPGWEHIHQERKRKGVTLALLWQEYKAQYPEGYGYVAFTVKYRSWKKQQNLSMRQEHKAGEKLFVDYAGVTVSITDPVSGKITPAQVFVAVMGASNYTYAEVTRSQGLEDWLGSHRRALAFFGGVPRLVIPDNLKTGVTNPCYYEPELNIAYTEFAQHYGLAVIPTRVRKPKDKAKVEVGVQIVERHILAVLRDRTFFSIHGANEAIWELLTELNNKPMQKLLQSRKELFEALDKPALHPLPSEPYVLANWKKARVNIDYHIELDGHYYSVPYHFAREQVDVRLTQNTLEVFHKGKRIASHRRLADLLQHRGRHSTLAEHMPKAHQRHSEWTPGRLINWAEKTGVYTAKIVEEILASRPHPEQGYRSCMGIIRLGKSYSSERLEAACKRACHFRAFSYKSVQSILQNKLDSEPLPPLEPEPQEKAKSIHPNVRGPSYYQHKTGFND